MKKNPLSLPELPRQKDKDILIISQGYPEADFKRIIRALHLKVTHQRLAILKALHEGRRHVTAQELFEMINGDHPEIGFATVYRFLFSLSDARFVMDFCVGV